MMLPERAATCADDAACGLPTSARGLALPAGFGFCVPRAFHPRGGQAALLALGGVWCEAIGARQAAWVSVAVGCRRSAVPRRACGAAGLARPVARQGIQQELTFADQRISHQSPFHSASVSTGTA